MTETRFSWEKLRAKARRKQKLYLLNTLTQLIAITAGFVIDLNSIQFEQKSQVILLIVLYLSYVLIYQASKNSSFFNPWIKSPWWNRIKALSSLLALTFLGFWVADQHLHLIGGLDRQYHTFYHAGLLMALISSLMNYRRAGQWWQLVDLTPGRMVFISYGVVSLMGGFFLILPISLNSGISIELIDAFFISVSAIAVTGLTTVNVAETFSMIGQSIILFLIQLGGLGIVVVSVALTSFTRNRLSLSQTLMGRELYDIPNVGAIGPFLKRVLAFTLTAEAIGLIGIYLALPEQLEHRFFHALFHTISAFCNAGFSSLPNNLHIPGLAGMKTLVCILVLFGGIGFPVLFELLSKISRKKAYRPLTSNTVLTLLMSITLLVVGFIGITLIETFETQSQFTWLDNFKLASFYTVSARTAGFNLDPVTQLTYGSQLLIAMLMIIGGSPLSTAGGIKTTTAGIILVSTYSLLRGHKWIQFRTSEMSTLILQKAVTLLVLYFFTLFTALILLVAIEPLRPWDITFEAISALSTVGLSLGITEKLSPVSKLIIMVLMLTGRLGFITMVYVGVGQVSLQKFRYARERYYIG